MTVEEARQHMQVKIDELRVMADALEEKHGSLAGAKARLIIAQTETEFERYLLKMSNKYKLN